MTNPSPSAECSPYVAAAKLLAAFGQELESTRAGVPEQLVVHPGQSVPMYAGSCGLGWTRVARVTPENPQRPQIGVVDWVVVIELGVWRCRRIIEPQKALPLAEMDSQARDELDDFAAMCRAGKSAFEDEDLEVTFGEWRAQLMGGAHGGTMTVSFHSSLPHHSPVDDYLDMMPGDPRQ